MSEEKTKLADTLMYHKKSFYEVFKPDAPEITAMQEYAKGYMTYMDASKTEREAVVASIALCEANGYREWKLGEPLVAGDRVYYNNRGKNLFVFAVGSEPINCGIRFVASHIDAPRLDLKPCPVYEDHGMGFFKTHYYGGIRKYQWVTVPLALHGVVVKNDGTVVDITVGEDDTDPVFYINDLLPHLGRADEAKPLGSAIPGEKLNILVGSQPLYEEGEDKPAADGVKLNVLKMLNERYGIVEEDFISAELSIVPAMKARDVGFDRSMIGAYGHDDRVCSYPALTALFESEDSVHTRMAILADKEEIGSEGVTGMQCELVLDLVDALAASLGGCSAIVRANSKCLSADVTANYEPNFSDVFEIRNSAIINCGVSLAKYTGSGGKGGTNDAPAEFVGWIRSVLNNAGVVWQMAELGRVDAGGGGTVAKYLSKHNIDTIDIGVGVTSMHAPYEVIAKADLYETHRAFKAFYLA
jgi:aspartyl aminopeptidase